MSEILQKLSPHRTAYLRGADGYGASASITQASASGLTVTGSFGAMDDFAVVVLWDADNTLEHYSLRYLPDFDFSGMTLSFRYASANLQPMDSTKYSWIDWGILDLIAANGQPLQVPLWPHATYASGSFTAASATVTISGTVIGSGFNLFINNTAFGYFDLGNVGGNACSSVAYAINTYDWSTYASASVAVLASFTGAGASSGTLTLTNAQTGRVNVSGTAVTWVSGATFQALFVGDKFVVNGATQTIASVNSPTSITLSGSAGTLTNVPYLAPRRGFDGNSITAYIVDDSSGLSFSQTTLPFSGGNSDNVAWNITIPFDSAIASQVGVSGGAAIAPNSLRQIVLTFAPALPNGTPYTGAEWSATLSNWTVTDTLGHRPLKIAGPGSVRIGSKDSWVSYSGSWAQVNAGNSLIANTFYRGFAYVSNTAGDSITIRYSSNDTHDLYLGTELYSDRGIVSVSLDGGAAINFDPFLNASVPLITRRRLFSGVAAGSHVVTITITGTKHTALGSWDANSSNTYFLFDYLEAAVLADVPDTAAVTYPNVSLACDYDNEPYNLSPERLVWQMVKLGALGQIDLYLGVFNLWKRIASGGVLHSLSIDLSAFSGHDAVQLNLNGFIIYKSIVGGDTAATTAAHFAYYINCASVGFWATVSGSSLIITQLAAGTSYALSSVTASFGNSGTYTQFFSGSLALGTQPNWILNDSASPIFNAGARAWLADFFATCAANSLGVSAAISMELVNPPSGYVAQFADGTAVSTATDLHGLYSNHCALGSSKMLALQKAALSALAALMQTAGLPIYLQLGEFLWWYFPEKQSIPLGYVANTFPASIGITAHGMSTGQNVVISGALDASGNLSAINGTWPVTRIDADHFTIPVAGGTWTPGTGFANFGGMAVYDAETTAAAVAALGRPLASFWTQDDDPTANAADVAFLSARLFSHIQTLISYIQGLYPSAQVELLYPYDVTYPSVWWNKSWPYAQGGRWNHAVNSPAQLESASASGLARLKMEALSCTSSYHDLSKAKQAIALPTSAPYSWALANTAYLVPVFTPGCAIAQEFLAAVNAGVPLIVLWALDQNSSLSWPWPLPQNPGTGRAS